MPASAHGHETEGNRHRSRGWRHAHTHTHTHMHTHAHTHRQLLRQAHVNKPIIGWWPNPMSLACLQQEPQSQCQAVAASCSHSFLAEAVSARTGGRELRGIWDEGAMKRKVWGQSPASCSGSWGACPPSLGKTHRELARGLSPPSAQDSTSVCALTPLLHELGLTPTTAQSVHILDSPTGAANSRRGKERGCSITGLPQGVAQSSGLFALCLQQGGEVFYFTHQPWSPYTCSKLQEAITHTHTHPKVPETYPTHTLINPCLLHEPETQSSANRNNGPRLHADAVISADFSVPCAQGDLRSAPQRHRLHVAGPAW